jgi:hypothetical protein
MSWAISTGEGGYIGVFWFHRGELPDYFDGQRTALFSTRDAARKRLKAIKKPKRDGGFPRARVEWVSIEIEASR